MLMMMLAMSWHRGTGRIDGPQTRAGSETPVVHAGLYPEFQRPDAALHAGHTVGCRSGRHPCLSGVGAEIAGLQEYPAA